MSFFNVTNIKCNDLGGHMNYFETIEMIAVEDGILGEGL